MQLSDPYMGTLGGYLAASLLVTPIVLTPPGVLRGRAAPLDGLRLLRPLRRPHDGDPGARLSADTVLYVEAVKRWILFALAIGTLLFGEKQKVREIAPGALVMLAGVVILSLAAA
jgi:hypothetical protein